MPSTRKPAADFDTGWKVALERFFAQGIQLFFPDIDEELDWSRGFEFLDKELQQARPQGKMGRRTVDKVDVDIVMGESS